MVRNYEMRLLVGLSAIALDEQRPMFMIRRGKSLYFST